MSGALEGRVALVTGGGRGIGAGISLALAAEGASVAVNYRRDADAAKETVAAIEAAGGSARAYAAAVEDYEAAAAMVESAVNDFGYVDILVHNAGIASRGRSVADTEVDELERLVRVHALSAHQLARHVLPSMRTRPRGDIVMISSVATSHYAANGAPYNMGKAALEALAFGLAKEERDNGIHVNVVAPGPRRDRDGAPAREGRRRRGHHDARRRTRASAGSASPRTSPQSWCSAAARRRAT